MINPDIVLHKWLKIPHSLHVGFDNKTPRPQATIVFIHGLASSHGMWDQLIKRVDPQSVRIVSVDLLGFGNSPKPTWQIYNALVHARALRLTLQQRRVQAPVILVGHSLGALVAVQYAKRYCRQVQQLILCSPPFYKPTKLAKEVLVAPLTQTDDAYHLLYRNSRYRHEMTRRLASFLKVARLTSDYFTVSDDTMPAIISSLEMSIENQTTIEDIKDLAIPIHILHGQFDPFVLKNRLREVKTANKHISITTLPVGHEITGPLYRAAVVSQIKKSLAAIHSDVR